MLLSGLLGPNYFVLFPSHAYEHEEGESKLEATFDIFGKVEGTRFYLVFAKCCFSLFLRCWVVSRLENGFV